MQKEGILKSQKTKPLLFHGEGNQCNLKTWWSMPLDSSVVTTWGYLVEQADEQDWETGIQHIVQRDEPVLVGRLQQRGNCRT